MNRYKFSPRLTGRICPGAPLLIDAASPDDAVRKLFRMNMEAFNKSLAEGKDTEELEISQGELNFLNIYEEKLRNLYGEQQNIQVEIPQYGQSFLPRFSTYEEQLKALAEKLLRDEEEPKE